MSIIQFDGLEDILCNFQDGLDVYYSSLDDIRASEEEVYYATIGGANRTLSVILLNFGILIFYSIILGSSYNSNTNAR